MAEKLDPQELESFKILLMSEVIQSKALVNLLEKKGIISKQELMEEIRKAWHHDLCNCHCRVG